MEKREIKKFDHEFLKKNYESALKDASFKYIASSIDVSDEEKMKHTSKIMECVQEVKNCKNCGGLHSCKNRVKGFVYYPKKMDNRMGFHFVACKYQKEKIDFEKNTCDYFEMPKNLLNASMNNIYTDDGTRIPLIKWLKNFYDTYEDDPYQRGLYLHGSFGSGKTYMLCAMLNELAKKGVDISVVYYPNLLLSLKNSFETDFASKIDKIKRVSILFLDDIGAESVTPWSRDEILGTILQYRMDASLPTFFTSNLTIEDLETNLSMTKNSVDKVKARRIIERIKQLTDDLELISKDRRKTSKK